jgi:hypothetical protein
VIFIISLSCNNSAEPTSSGDTSIKTVDTMEPKIVTEGGLKDSLKIGASDSADKKNADKK